MRLGVSRTLHFIHVGKTGGSALAGALVRAGYANWPGGDQSRPIAETPYGRIQFASHSMRRWTIPVEDHFFFCLRDPIARFMSAFYSRLNRGQPRYFFEWTVREQMIFEVWQTPQELAAGLISGDEVDRQLAEWGLENIRHLRPLPNYVGMVPQLKKRREMIAYVARQETLAEDWVAIRKLFGIPEDVELETDEVRAHRMSHRYDTSLEPEVEAALREFYARDYRVLEFCEELRRERGWGPYDAPRKPSLLKRFVR